MNEISIDQQSETILHQECGNRMITDKSNAISGIFENPLKLMCFTIKSQGEN